MRTTAGLVCALTFELSGRRRQGARARTGKMYRVPQAGPWWPAVGAPLERGVRPQRRCNAIGMAACSRMRLQEPEPHFAGSITYASWQSRGRRGLTRVLLLGEVPRLSRNRGPARSTGPCLGQSTSGARHPSGERLRSLVRASVPYAASSLRTCGP